MGHALQAEAGLDHLDDVEGLAAGAPAGAPGHGDVGRVEALEALGGAEQSLGRLVILGGKELEGEAMARLGELVGDLHGWRSSFLMAAMAARAAS